MAGPDDEQVEAPPRVTYGDPFPLPVPPRPCSKKIAFERPRPAGLTVHEGRRFRACDESSRPILVDRARLMARPKVGIAGGLFRRRALLDPAATPPPRRRLRPAIPAVRW
jgi:hypothetical protein